VQELPTASAAAKHFHTAIPRSPWAASAPVSWAKAAAHSSKSAVNKISLLFIIILHSSIFY
jgi:hypothetical protein